MSDFEVGEWVECVDNSTKPELTIGSVYQVEGDGIYGISLNIRGYEDSWYFRFRFKKVSEKHLGTEELELEVDKKKDDITKAKPGQLFEDFNLALLAVSEVTRYGIEKYERPGSWKHAHKDLMKYKDAAGRHQLKQPTEMYDDESGYLHLIQVCWNNLALLQMMLEFGKTEPRDVSKITKPIEGLTQENPQWFKGETDEV